MPFGVLIFSHSSMKGAEDDAQRFKENFKNGFHITTDVFVA